MKKVKYTGKKSIRICPTHCEDVFLVDMTVKQSWKVDATGTLLDCCEEFAVGTYQNWKCAGCGTEAVIVDCVQYALAEQDGRSAGELYVPLEPVLECVYWVEAAGSILRHIPVASPCEDPIISLNGDIIHLDAIRSIQDELFAATYKETRRISARSLRDLCIEQGWYTAGDNMAYQHLLYEMADEKENISTEDIAAIALDIIKHSSNLSEDDFGGVAFEVAKVAVVRIIRNK